MIKECDLSTFQHSSLQSYWRKNQIFIFYKSPQTWLRIWTHTSEGLTMVQQFLPAFIGALYERQSGAHVTRQNKCCHFPIISAQPQTHTASSVGQSSSATFKCLQAITHPHAVSERKRGRERLLWGIWHCCYSEAKTILRKVRWIMCLFIILFLSSMFICFWFWKLRC